MHTKETRPPPYSHIAEETPLLPEQTPPHRHQPNKPLGGQTPLSLLRNLLRARKAKHKTHLSGHTDAAEAQRLETLALYHQRNDLIPQLRNARHELDAATKDLKKRRKEDRKQSLRLSDSAARLSSMMANACRRLGCEDAPSRKTVKLLSRLSRKTAEVKYMTTSLSRARGELKSKVIELEALRSRYVAKVGEAEALVKENLKGEVELLGERLGRRSAARCNAESEKRRMVDRRRGMLSANVRIGR